MLSTAADWRLLPMLRQSSILLPMLYLRPSLTKAVVFLFFPRLLPPACTALLFAKKRKRLAWAGGGWPAPGAPSGYRPRAHKAPAQYLRRESGSSRMELAYAHCAATASSAAHLEAQADWAGGRNQAGIAATRCRVRRRRNVAASAPNLPPTSRPTTTSLACPWWPWSSRSCMRDWDQCVP